ncbi:DUF2200 domain-containing protein [Carnobacteriaceae bacterium zg-ZUI78]|uniref:DUF2200 domain-containing protein n=1 Tax=Granulicatella sp. zg-84 TaxID=2678503 RepID=UPI0013C1BC8D|nr:DUF2200 domain-containing protein [Granulicatella sp. zg-84]MBS4750586.1 DUF2200 domain-containing protein [Carnobacteriaceae bacterium zg-ZUI78]NEW66815.1 DUF2200 family protein [Granulicatella sp. zg-84]QMI85342.1 DUF2200 domain-containing protein [Carnobacteriaceae bacterium zg-84]
MKKPKIFDMCFSVIHDAYVKKAVRKQRTKEEVDTIICWLTGYSVENLHMLSRSEHITLEQFFNQAPHINEHADLITGTICGVRIEEIEDDMMKKIRWLDKLIDELAKGKAIDKILK